MQIQNEQKLLEDFAYYIESNGLFSERIEPLKVVGEFLKSSNNMSECERQPVGNNEQGGNNCSHQNIIVDDDDSSKGFCWMCGTEFNKL